jgi:hypothetical protein
MLEIRNVMTLKIPKKKKNPECREMEPNPSKDRTLYVGDNLSF